MFHFSQTIAMVHKGTKQKYSQMYKLERADRNGLLRRLEKRLEKKMKIPVHINE